MRQGNGADILGLNNSRNASIGVIYVSANDENSHVIHAIQGQARLGRKQVAVVLAEQHKAFQHPEDFDELKRIRNTMQTQVVFITPDGRGPAEFARQRRFLVYPSLENYTKALHGNSADKRERMGGLFRRRQSGTEQEQLLPEVPAQGAALQETAQDTVEEKDSRPSSSRMRAIIIGGAESIASTASSGRADHDVPSRIKKNDEEVQAPQGEESVAAHEEGASHSGPAIIDLHSTRIRGKETVKLSSVTKNQRDELVMLPLAVGAGSVAASETSAPHGSTSGTRRASRPSGKVAAVGTGTTQSANGGSGRRVAGGLAATSLANTATGGTPPPTMNRGGGRGGGGGAGRRGAVILGLVALLVLTGGVVSAIAYSQPGLLGSLKNIVKSPNQSTVTITPASKTENYSYVLVGVQQAPDASKLQISARVIKGTSPSQSKTTPATGVKQTPGVAATGTLTFINSLTVEQTVKAGTVFTGKDGVQIVNNVAANIPPANPPAGTFGKVTVSAHAVRVGQIGNINASDIYGSCCTKDNSIFVQNSAFSGGQDPQNYTFVQQSDINGVVNALEPSLLQQAENSLKSQVHSNEQLAGSVTCSPSVGQNQNAGDKASSVTVTVSVTCQSVAYDQKGALSLVTSQLSKQASKDLGSNYALVGSIVTTLKVQKVTSTGVSLLATAKGVWVYQFSSSAQQNLKSLIAGKNVTEAVTLLKSQPGISDASINPNSGTLSTNPNDITIVIQPVAGLSGGGSSSGGASLTPTVTGPGTGPTTQTGNG